jgi:hypothetical protein
MSRRIYIGDIDGNAELCRDKIKRCSEEVLDFDIITLSKLKDYEISKTDDTTTLMYFVPFLNHYTGLALFVPSNFNPKVDVDLFFSHKVHNDISNIVYYSNHDAWLFDCSDPAMQILNPFFINQTTVQNINRELRVTIVDNI